MLVEFHQHATGLHVVDLSAGRPNTIVAFVDVASTASSTPPTAILATIISGSSIVVAVRSGEHHAVDITIRVSLVLKGVAGVSAVPGHRQTVLTNLISDGERRVFSRVPQTRSTLDLLTDTLLAMQLFLQLVLNFSAK